METINAGMLPHRLTVWRDTGARDRFGQRDIQIVNTERGLPYPGVGMEPTSTNIRCRASTPTGGQRFDERSQLVIVTFFTVFCDPSADVGEADRVQVYEPTQQRIIIPDGIILLVTPVYAMEIIHHLELKVELVRAPQSGGLAQPGTEGVTTP